MACPFSGPFSTNSCTKWKLELLVFEYRGNCSVKRKPLYSKEYNPKTYSTDMWLCCMLDENVGPISGRPVLSPLCNLARQRNLLWCIQVEIFLKLIICFVCLFFTYLQITENLPELIERTVFHKFGRLINNNYKRKMRSLVFTLKHRDAIRNRVLSGEITVEKFVNSSPDQLLT